MLNEKSLNDVFETLIKLVCESIEEFRHYDSRNLLVSISHSRGSGRYGVLAYVVPMYYVGGKRERRGIRRGLPGHYYYESPAMREARPNARYLMTFVLPKFFRYPARERLETIVHELYHVHPTMRGDLRRFNRPHHIHGPTPAKFNQKVKSLTAESLRNWPELINHPLLTKKENEFSSHKRKRYPLPKLQFKPHIEASATLMMLILFMLFFALNAQAIPVKLVQDQVLYQESGDRANAVGNLSRGTEVNAQWISKDRDWIYIESDYLQGWVPRAAIQGENPEVGESGANVSESDGVESYFDDEVDVSGELDEVSEEEIRNEAADEESFEASLKIKEEASPELVDEAAEAHLGGEDFGAFPEEGLEDESLKEPSVSEKSLESELGDFSEEADAATEEEFIDEAELTDDGVHEDVEFGDLEAELNALDGAGAAAVSGADAEASVADLEGSDEEEFGLEEGGREPASIDEGLDEGFEEEDFPEDSADFPKGDEGMPVQSRAAEDAGMDEELLADALEDSNIEEGAFDDSELITEEEEAPSGETLTGYDRNFDQAYVRSQGQLYSKASEFGRRFSLVEKDDEVDILQHDPTGKWVKIRVDVTGEEGWYQKKDIRVQHLRRPSLLGNASLEILPSYGTKGYNFGVSTGLYFNLTKGGLTGRPLDQFNIGLTGGYWLGETSQISSATLSTNYWAIAAVLRYTAISEGGYYMLTGDLGFGHFHGSLETSGVDSSTSSEVGLSADNITDTTLFLGIGGGIRLNAAWAWYNNLRLVMASSPKIQFSSGLLISF